MLRILFSKKKTEEPKEEDAAQASGSGSGGEPEMSIGAVVADIAKIKAQLESFGEIRKANSERFATINEQIGEIRGQIMDTNRNMGTLEVKVTKAADLVESVHPDKLMIQVQKSDGKVEALRGIIESKDAMIQNIMEQLKGMRHQMKVFKGIEEVLKLNENVKTEVMNMKKLTATVERHSDRVENVFVESQRTFKDFNDVVGQISVIKSQLKEATDKLDKLDIKSAKFIDTKQFESRVNEIEKLGKEIKHVHISGFRSKPRYHSPPFENPAMVKKAVTCLKKTGYCGFVVAEMDLKYETEKNLRKTKKFFDNVIGG
ncbi:hypothetical protein HZB90_04095 [archaeon]|nr:hypothetical protein [archaeon]